MAGAPPQDYLDYLDGNLVKISSRVDIYERDGKTPWRDDVDLLGGQVSVTFRDDGRRTISATLAPDNDLVVGVGGLWYDKIIKPYRTIEPPDLPPYDFQLGEFEIDTLQQSRFPREISFTGRDRTKTLQLSKFLTATAFTEDDSVSDVIRAIASNGGITQFTFQADNSGTMGKRFAFERGTSRWESMVKLAQAANLDLFFDRFGRLVLRPFVDPAATDESYTFNDANLTKLDRSTSDGEIFNVVIVTGEGADIVPPIQWVASNDDPTSPTGTPNIGNRVTDQPSPFITTVDEAKVRAEALLSIASLEQWEIQPDSVVVPWLETGDVVLVNDPEPISGQPARFVLTRFDIPLSAGSMAASGRRISPVSRAAFDAA